MAMFHKTLLLVIMHSVLTLSALASCALPNNPIEAENCLPGNPASEWYVPWAGSANIQGFTTDISVNTGANYFFQGDNRRFVVPH